MILVYDGTFESFLTLVYDVYYQKLEVSSILKKTSQTFILEDLQNINYDQEKSLKVLEALKKKFTKRNFETILNIFMCDTKEFELDLLHFIILGFKNQNELSNINHPFVFALHNLQKELFRHNHKLTGFLRFVELEDKTLYAKVDSKFNVVYFLGKHFLKRFNNQNYIIHDLQREIAFIKNESFLGVQEVSSFEEPKTSEDEQKFSKLWKTFFDAVAIESRENKKLQQQMVPLLYRTYMNEFL
jgi:probable DNA metabolism protein